MPRRLDADMMSGGSTAAIKSSSCSSSLVPDTLFIVNSSLLGKLNEKQRQCMRHGIRVERQTVAHSTLAKGGASFKERMLPRATEIEAVAD